MATKRNRSYLGPLFYTLVWCSSLCIGVFGLLPRAEGVMRMIIAAFSVYSIFIVNSMIDVFLYYVKAVTKEVRPAFAWILFMLAVPVVASLFLSKLYVTNSKTIFLIGILFSMGLSHYGMGVIKHNTNICFIEDGGNVFNTRMK